MHGVVVEDSGSQSGARARVQGRVACKGACKGRVHGARGGLDSDWLIHALMPMRELFIASSGVAGTLHTLPALEE